MLQVQAKVLDEALMTDELPNTFDNCEILLQDDLSILQYLSSGTPEVSLHAVAAQSNPRTLCIIGKIRSTNVQVVVDGGSTYNFIQERLAKFLGLPSPSLEPLSVLGCWQHTLQLFQLFKKVSGRNPHSSKSFCLFYLFRVPRLS